MREKSYLMALLIIAALFSVQISDCSAKEKKAKYVFYFIGDGMGVNQVNGTEMYLAQKDGKIGVKPLNFTQFPVCSIATTYSTYNPVTDSAAAGTALSTGEKTKNGTIGMDSLRKTPLYSIAVKAKKAGRRVGVTTSVSVDHATPAVFYAHQPDRNMYYEIATDLPKAGFDFYAGSGFLEPQSKKDSTAINIFTLFDKTGYVVAKGYEDFKSKQAKSAKMIMIQKDGTDPESIPYAIDRKPGDLTLSQITESAITFLTKEDKGFFVMIEGGKIDWACHGNDAGTAFNEVVDLANAIDKALEFYKKHPDETLIVLTADHETGGIALGTGTMTLNLKALANQKVSQEGLTAKIKELRIATGNKVSWEQIKELLSNEFGFWRKVSLSEKQEKQLKDEFARSFGEKASVTMTKSLYAEDEPIASLAKSILNEIALVGWTSGNHTAGYAPVYAIGAGSELFQGKMDNTDIPKRISQAAGY